MCAQYHNIAENLDKQPLIAGVLFLTSLLVANHDSLADDAVPQVALAPARHFTESVLPLLKQHCYECHSHDAGTAEGGLVLDSQSGWRIGGDSGPAIVPGVPEKSLLLTALVYSDTELQMPPEGRLSERDIATLRKWIAGGAYDPRVTKHGPGNKASTDLPTSDLWSLQSLQLGEIPDVGDSPWVRNTIDRFILAKLQADGASPNIAADKHAILRRATFDLTGLPPTLDEMTRFTHDNRPDAYQQLIDRLLDSPHYGERWGRHWLDLARYGDSNGGDINYAHANAWRYRDYVIASFNNDKPYDSFIREQLAGDLLAAHANAVRRRELLTATGFLMLGPKMLAEVDTEKLLIDIVDEQLDVTGLTFLGMTFGCARCHDHKFDPITAEDYYAMAGIFRSTKVIDVLRPSNGVSEWLEVDATPAETMATIKKLERNKKRLQELLADLGEPTGAKANSAIAAGKAIRAPKLPSLQSTTWAAWVRIASPQKLGGVISAAYEGANQGHSLGFDQGSTPRIVWNHGVGSHTIIAASRPISFGQWHHLGLTFEADSERLKLFVDGRVAAAATNVATSAFNTIGVGRREASRQFPFIGDVDDVQIYDSALNEAQLLAIFTKHTPIENPLLHWSFDQVRGDQIVDVGPGGFDGQLIRTSAQRSIVEDGAVGTAFSFSALKEDSPEDVARRGKVAELRTQIQDIIRATPSATLVMAVAAARPVDLPVHLRGSHLKLADTPTARSTPRVFNRGLEPVVVPPSENGRLQLANWIASPDNPLTARVMVNRIWQHHFGDGLVRTPSNFGARGEQPSHPKLLDWLADEFMKNNWSVKHMHRLIMNSATYRMSSRHNVRASKQDSDNRLLSSYPVRRLEAEAIRDALLAVTGELDRTSGGTLVQAENKKRVTMSPVDPIYDSFRRAVYLPAVRVRGYAMFSIFDVSDNGQHVANRPQTMVAQQALFLMNNRFVIERARRLAELVAQQTGSLEDRVDWLYRTLYGRIPNASETAMLESNFIRLSASSVSHRPEDNGGMVVAWRQIIHAMFCANEFIHVR